MRIRGCLNFIDQLWTPQQVNQQSLCAAAFDPRLRSFWSSNTLQSVLHYPSIRRRGLMMDVLLPILLCIAGVAVGLPAEPTPASNAEIALITSPPDPTLAVYASYDKQKRGVLSDITAGLDSYVNGIFSELGTTNLLVF